MRPRLLLPGIAALYLLLAGLTAYTKAPWRHEAWYGTPGWNLLTHGSMGTSALDPASTSWKQVKLTGIDRRTYWALPLEFLAEVPWYARFGFGILSLRALSICWGLAALAAWYGILEALTGRRESALLAAALLACDFVFVTRAADGRMDMMSGALAAVAAFAYLRLREQHWTEAVPVSCALAAAAFFTHPNGGILAILGLAALAGWLDLRRLRLRDALWAAAPFLAGGMAWFAYIQRDPAAFRDQFFTAAAARGQSLSPLTAFRAELGRYLTNYGFAPWDHPSAHIAFLMPLVYAGAFLYCLANLRSRPPIAALLSWTASYFLYLTFFDGLKTYLYLVYIVPLLAAVTAAAAAAILAPRRVPIFVGAALLLAYAAIPTIHLVRRIAADDYHRTYLSAARYLQEHREPSDVVVASAEMGFAVGFDGRLVDDVLLGYRTGRRPAFLILDDARYRDNLTMLQTADPPIYRYATDLLANHYRLVYNYCGYTIYRSLPAAPR